MPDVRLRLVLPNSTSARSHATSASPGGASASSASARALITST